MSNSSRAVIFLIFFLEAFSSSANWWWELNTLWVCVKKTKTNQSGADCERSTFSLRENALNFVKFSQPGFFRECIEISLERLYRNKKPQVIKPLFALLLSVCWNLGICACCFFPTSEWSEQARSTGTRAKPPPSPPLALAVNTPPPPQFLLS